MTTTQAATNAFIALPEGPATVGKPLDFPSYGWDNEYGSRTETVPAFAATEKLVNATWHSMISCLNLPAFHWIIK